jgi:DnaJ-domain-containing protein 1
MTSVGRRPTLSELLEALYAIKSVEADADALNPERETFRVVLTFQRAQCPQDWIEGQPKPTWLFEQIIEELAAWERQRYREEQWVSKEEQFGASIDTLMAHWTEELKKNSSIKPENMLTRALKQILSNTILRLKELKERREAGGVYSATENRRDKARKAWMEDEFEAPRREEEQRKQRQQRDWRDEPFIWPGGSAADMEEEIRRKAEDFFRTQYGSGWENFFTGRRQKHQQQDPLKPQSGNKLPWYKILGVPADATKEQIKKAHRALVKLHQPRTSADAEDKQKTARMAEINTARDEGLSGL